MTTIANNQELWCAIEATALAVVTEGHIHDAALLRDALTISPMPGEIFGELKLVLTYLSRNTVISPDLLSGIYRELAVVKTALKI
jgi:hypothetical protein